jgi:hypothetical protein
MMASHMDPQHRTTLSARRPTAGCACRGTALTARERGARTSGCRQHSRFDAAETGLIEVPRPKTADRNSPDAPCVIGSSGRGSGLQNLCKQRFPVREAPLDGSGSAGLFLLPKDTAARELKAGRLTEFCLRRTALTLVRHRRASQRRLMARMRELGQIFLRWRGPRSVSLTFASAASANAQSPSRNAERCRSCV